jgi:hypothetical protein
MIQGCNVGVEDFFSSSPPEPPDEFLALQDEIETLEARAQDISEAQDAWTDMNVCLHRLTGLPQEIIDAWDTIKPWLDSHGQECLSLLVYAREKESDLLW